MHLRVSEMQSLRYSNLLTLLKLDTQPASTKWIRIIQFVFQSWLNQRKKYEFKIHNLYFLDLLINYSLFYGHLFDFHHLVQTLINLCPAMDGIWTMKYGIHNVLLTDIFSSPTTIKSITKYYFPCYEMQWQPKLLTTITFCITEAGRRT